MMSSCCRACGGARSWAPWLRCVRPPAAWDAARVAALCCLAPAAAGPTLLLTTDPTEPHRWRPELLVPPLSCSPAQPPMQVHAENGDAVAEGQQRVFAAGITGPEGHALSRPAVLEGEATARAIRLAQFAGAPLYVVHVMSRDAMEEVARAR